MPNHGFHQGWSSVRGVRCRGGWGGQRWGGLFVGDADMFDGILKVVAVEGVF